MRWCVAMRRLIALGPWLLSLAIAGMAAIFGGGGVRAVAIGAALGLSVGLVCAGVGIRATARSMRGWMSERESELSVWSDDRAAALARQFDWAVAELVAVRAENRRVDLLRSEAELLAASASERADHQGQLLEAARARLTSRDPTGGAERLVQLESELRATELARQDEERERRAAERRAKTAQQQVADLARTLRKVAATATTHDGERTTQATSTEPVNLDWTLEFDGASRALRLRPSMPLIRLRRARILDTASVIVAETEPGRRARARDLVLTIPQSVAAAVESADWAAFRLEVLVGAAWAAAALVDRSAEASARSGRSPSLRPTELRVVV
jgi:hypothetical protein